MYQFHKIKLVVWDLDDTFWSGTRSEGSVQVPDAHRQLLQTLSDCGIVNSICSKNDFSATMAHLSELDLAQWFVFPSISWEPKGQRIRQLIADMQLRPENVLFLDDNPSNLGEALHYCPALMTGGPEQIPLLIQKADAAPKKDPEHKRLQQYRILEQKHQAKSEVSSNEAFLFQSNIRVQICTDCLPQLERIQDLLLRANQLNFTKVRSSEAELRALLEDPAVSAGYVSVQDRFGDYGITGFYAMKNNCLLHFCFSCRTLGMGIEQYVYHMLNRPELQIVEEVISDLSCPEAPGWINQAEETSSGADAQAVHAQGHSVLMKGPCDLFQILPYIADRGIIDTEFTYTASNGTTIESTGHTTHIVEAIRLSNEQKRRVLEEVPFLHEGIYRDSIYKNDYRVVIISILADANLGIYRRKGTGERLAFLEGYRPLTDPANWDGYINGEYNCSSVKFTRKMLEAFADKYEFAGINTPEQIVENLRCIKAHLPKDCTLAVMLGGELYYEKNTFPAYETRHLIHKAINNAIRESAREIGLELIDVNLYLTGQDSFYDHFNHYIKPVYYALAGEIVSLINRQTGGNLRETSRMKMVLIRVKEFLWPFYNKTKQRIGGILHE